MLLNSNHPRERRNQSAGHETGHFVSTRNRPEVLHVGRLRTPARSGTPTRLPARS